MSMTAQQYNARLSDDQKRAVMAAFRNQAMQIVRGCTTEDEKYEKIRDSVNHDMIWRMIHGS